MLRPPRLAHARSRATRPLALALAATAVLAAAPRAAAAQSCTTVAGNLVQNCGFEGSTYIGGPPKFGSVPTGYTLTGNNGGGNANVVNNSSHSGSNAFAFEDVTGQSATLSQTLTTAAGATYQISFFAFNDFGNNPNNLLAVTFGGVPVFGSVLLNGSYQQFTVTGVATSASTVLAFTGFNDPGFEFIDDLSVTPLATTAPEPSTWALVGAGLVAVGGLARRRRRPPAA